MEFIMMDSLATICGESQSIDCFKQSIGCATSSLACIEVSRALIVALNSTPGWLLCQMHLHQYPINLTTSLIMVFSFLSVQKLPCFECLQPQCCLLLFVTEYLWTAGIKLAYKYCTHTVWQIVTVDCDHSLSIVTRVDRVLCHKIVDCYIHYHNLKTVIL